MTLSLMLYLMFFMFVFRFKHICYCWMEEIGAFWLVKLDHPIYFLDPLESSKYLYDIFVTNLFIFNKDTVA